MRIDRVRLVNYRCFADRTFDLASRFNLVVGDNGAGKTSLLEGLAVMPLTLIGCFRGVPSPRADANIAREVTHWDSGQPHVEVQRPVQIEVTGAITGQKELWRLNPSESGLTWSSKTQLDRVAEKIASLVSANAPVVLPAHAIYKSGRRWGRDDAANLDTLSPGSRFLGYENCFEPSSDEKRLLAWFKTKELIALQKQRPLFDLEAVRATIRSCLPAAESVYWDLETDQLAIRLRKRVSWFRHLSDGYRNMLGMVADLARRCVTLNPHLGAEAIAQTPGCVLIDELDLHLHPKWQRDVVSQLMRTFPQVQFVATTHSPFIIQSLPTTEDVKLINLDDAADADFAGKSVEDIAEHVQHVPLPQRSQRWLDMMDAAKRYYQTLEQSKDAAPERIAELRQELDRLMLPFSDDPAYQALLQQQRVFSGIDGRNGHAAG